MDRISNILKLAEASGNRKLARKLRIDVLDGLMEKQAQSAQSGIFQVFRDDKIEYPYRENKITERGGPKVKTKDLYNLAPEHKKMDSKHKLPSRSLSTRYSPDRVGVQARRIADGVYQDPYTNKIYNWNDGFTTEDGQKFGGGHVSLQTDLTSR